MEDEANISSTQAEDSTKVFWGVSPFGGKANGSIQSPLSRKRMISGSNIQNSKDESPVGRHTGKASLSRSSSFGAGNQEISPDLFKVFFNKRKSNLKDDSESGAFGSNPTGSSQLKRAKTLPIAGSPLKAFRIDEILSDLTNHQERSICVTPNEVQTDSNVIDDDLNNVDWEDFWEGDLPPTNENVNASTNNVVEMEEIEDLSAFAEDLFVEDHELDNHNKTSKGESKSVVSRTVLKRFCICKINASIKEQILHLVNIDNQDYAVCRLRGLWRSSKLDLGMIIHIIGSFSNALGDEIIVDDNQNFLVTSPNVIINGTTVSASNDCERRAFLGEKFKGPSFKPDSLSAFVGNYFHEIFQHCLMTRDFSDQSVNNILDELIETQIDSVYSLRSLGLSESSLKTELLEYQRELAKFPRQHLQKTSDVLVKNVVDIEELIVSPSYGLQGKIDASLQVDFKDGNSAQPITPFELKTSKYMDSVEHRSQALLYSILMSERYDVPYPKPLLYYVNKDKSSMNVLMPGRNELRDLIFQRNHLASSISDNTLPQTTHFARSCEFCYQRDSCLATYQSLNNLDVSSHPYIKSHPEKKKLLELDLETRKFLTKWLSLLDEEDQVDELVNQQIWQLPAEVKETEGNCISNLCFLSIEDDHAGTSSVLKKSSFGRFRCWMRFAEPVLDPNKILHSQIAIGDPIIVSAIPSFFVLAKGYLTNIDGAKIEVLLDRNALEVYDRIRLTRQIPGANSQNGLFRIDKNEHQNGRKRIRGHLVSFAMNPVYSRFRDMIIHRKPPVFCDDVLSPANRSLIEIICKKFNFNSNQKSAVLKAVTAKDYTLILGLPGTGKSTVLAVLVFILSKILHKRVLISSYTHNAVDNILLKIQEYFRDEAEQVAFLRLGSMEKIHPDIRDTCWEAVKGSLKSVEQIRTYVKKHPVVAVTCLALNHNLLTCDDPSESEQMFDYCIIDEAGQITLPVSIGPISLSKTFVLVGDHFQLPPLVKSPIAARQGLCISLFRHLSESGSANSMTYLTHQYRMNEEIAAFANKIVYRNLLKCGDDSVASRRLPGFPAKLDFWKFSYPYKLYSDITKKAWNGDWLAKGMSSSMPLLWLDTDRLGVNLEERRNHIPLNLVELDIITMLIHFWGCAGISLEKHRLVVLSPYRYQLLHLQEMWTTISFASKDIVEISTIDKYQGRDSDIVIMSLVRSNDGLSCGDNLRSWNRINVAVTRAKRKFIMIGSVKTLSVSSALWRGIQEEMLQNGQIHQI